MDRLIRLAVSIGVFLCIGSNVFAVAGPIPPIVESAALKNVSVDDITAACDRQGGVVFSANFTTVHRRMRRSLPCSSRCIGGTVSVPSFQWKCLNAIRKIQ